MAETKFDSILNGIKNRRYVAIALVAGVVIIAMGTLTDSIDKTLSFGNKQLSSGNKTTAGDALRILTIDNRYYKDYSAVFASFDNEVSPAQFDLGNREIVGDLWIEPGDPEFDGHGV
jgi:hypothetical protein